jgi:hypothetical protein
VREPEDVGFARRLVRVYRAKRRPQPVIERWYGGPAGYRLVRTQRRMPRRAAWQIAWHQALNVRGDCGCG